MSLKKSILFIAFTFISVCTYSQTEIKHVVNPGETLYSLSKRYNVSVESIKKANGLTSDLIKAGYPLIIPSSSPVSSPSPTTVPVQPQPNQSTPTTNIVPSASVVTSPTLVRASTETDTISTTVRRVEIQIPKCKLTYITDKKTTVAEICVKFGISESEFFSSNPEIKKTKIKKNTTLCIPYTESERNALIAAEAKAAADAQRNAEAASAEENRRIRQAEAASEINKIDTIKVAIVLPFELNQEAKSQEAIKMIDFYEGIILSTKELGASVEIEVYDEKEKSIETIINEISKKSFHLIIGAKNVEYTNHLRAYSKRNDVIMCVPFSSKEDLTVGHPTLFQVNVKSSLLYNEVYKLFTEENRGKHVMFVTGEQTDNNYYISDFQQYLSEHGISHSTIGIDNLSSAKEIASSGKQVVLIPSEKSVDYFRQITNILDTYDSNISSNISLFGYPEWQTFSEENTQKLRFYHCSFYTTFYTNIYSEDVINFSKRFKEEFKRDQYNSRPLYGLLGYDVSNYFIGGLKQYGKKFISSQDLMNVHALQNPMRFDRNSSRQNGFTNQNIRIIHP